MSSDPRLLLGSDWYPHSGILSGINISIISRAYQLFGSTIESLALARYPFPINRTLQMKLEDDGIVSALSSVFQF